MRAPRIHTANQIGDYLNAFSRTSPAVKDGDTEIFAKISGTLEFCGTNDAPSISMAAIFKKVDARFSIANGCRDAFPKSLRIPGILLAWTMVASLKRMKSLATITCDKEGPSWVNFNGFQLPSVTALSIA